MGAFWLVELEVSAYFVDAGEIIILITIYKIISGTGFSFFGNLDAGFRFVADEALCTFSVCIVAGGTLADVYAATVIVDAGFV